MEAEIRNLVAELTVEASPAGAVVAVDGNRVGASPLGAPLVLGPGAHVVSVVAEGFETEERKVKVVSGGRVSERFSLKALPAGTRAAASPGNAGAASRFDRTSCGSLKDEATGIEWFIGPDEDTTFFKAKAWVAGLSACGRSWRLPTASELASLHSAPIPTHGRFAWSGDAASIPGCVKIYDFRRGRARAFEMGYGSGKRAFAVAAGR
jgi:hypothetical protein